jgi:hypothetical protein
MTKLDASRGRIITFVKGVHFQIADCRLRDWSPRVSFGHVRLWPAIGQRGFGIGIISHLQCNHVNNLLFIHKGLSSFELYSFQVMRHQLRVLMEIQIGRCYSSNHHNIHVHSMHFRILRWWEWDWEGFEEKLLHLGTADPDIHSFVLPPCPTVFPSRIHPRRCSKPAEDDLNITCTWRHTTSMTLERKEPCSEANFNKKSKLHRTKRSGKSHSAPSDD